jgi:uncharacterized phiE125 gp8 family phage protein
MYNRVIVAPPVEPLTLAQVKLDRAIEHSLHDDLLSALITAAREYVEQYCGISIITQTREAAFDAFTTYLDLDYGPVQSVSAVEYQDSDSSVVAFTQYVANLYGHSPRVSLAYNATWPTSAVVANAITVRYVAGFAPVAGSPTDYTGNVPQALRTAMKLLIGNWYENREATITGTINQALELGVSAILDRYRMRKSMA